jgi:hypothetical protein
MKIAHIVNIVYIDKYYKNSDIRNTCMDLQTNNYYNVYNDQLFSSKKFYKNKTLKYSLTY